MGSGLQGLTFELGNAHRDRPIMPLDVRIGNVPFEVRAQGVCVRNRLFEWSDKKEYSTIFFHNVIEVMGDLALSRGWDQINNL